ncbi:DUF998 domain-containing protein [Secundilactobacillus oryzae]|uniref:DUF998 domain-containing protein n=1 Tax=Secundilactobacillus oryzae TaxID=1202668 RepID=UPI000B0E055B|nr:DUF998 domain-containing protein [Secundilactobacillus oryzae]
MIHLKRKKVATIEAFTWRSFPTLTIAAALIYFMVMSGLFWIGGTLFKGATFDLLTSTILFAVITQLSVQVAGSVASMLSPRLLTNTFIVVIAGGVILAMLSNQNLYWWKRSLSFLGTTHATDSWEFNAALIFAGLILVALIDYLFVSLKRVFPGDKRLLIMRILLTLLAINLAAVGLFPNDDALHLIHVRVAGNLVYIIIALIVGVKWLLPNITKEFRQISWLMAGGLVATEILFEIVGYLSLTAFEILAFLLAFSWTIMLFERLNDYLEPSQMDIYEVK